MRLLRLLGLVMIAAVVAAAVSTLVLLTRRTDQVGRGPLAVGGQGGATLAAVQRALPSVVRVERGRPPSASPLPTASPTATASATTTTPGAGGTGLVVDSRGYILTAEALVAGADALSVAVPGGRTVAARVVSSDPADALTLLKVDGADLHALGIGGAATLDTGSGVVVLAAPGYLQVAVGAVASAHASVLVQDPASPGRRRPLNDLLALDVAARDGQLGAPVLDGSGRPSGMVVAADGQVYATDLTQAQALVQQMIDSGHVSYPSLGFEYAQLSVSDAADLDVPGGVRLTAVEAPAAAQGLAVGDVVVSAGGTTLDPAHPLARILRGLSVHQSVALETRAKAPGSARRTISLDVQLVTS